MFPNRSAWPSLPNAFNVFVAVIVFGEVRVTAVDVVISNHGTNTGRTINVLDDAAFDGDVTVFLWFSLHKKGPIGPVLSQKCQGATESVVPTSCFPVVLLSSPTSVRRSP